MNSNEILSIILAFLVWEFALTKYIGYLNTTYWSDTIPEELTGIYDQAKYRASQVYDRTKYKFWLVSSTFSFFVILFALTVWFFGSLDMFLRWYFQNEILLCIVFFNILVILQTLISLPFDYYSTFVIEKEFGFNKSTKMLFFLDMIKWLLLTVIISSVLLGLIAYIYTLVWPSFWMYAWMLITAFSIVMMMFYSSLIVPLFNKQTPLEDGELKNAIQNFAKKVGFKLDNIYVMDGSKRSTKANAYFTWLWGKKRIVLFDTLIHDLSTEEIVAVLAHEIGHYKKKHTFQMLIFSIIQTWVMLYILSLALKIPEVSLALWASTASFYMWALAFGMLFTPVSVILGILWNVLSRKNEYEADAYATQNFWGNYLQSALKKLSINNLSNLKPHPIYEFFHYSHPTVLKRLQAMEK